MVGLGLQARRLAFSTTKSGDFAERGYGYKQEKGKTKKCELSNTVLTLGIKF